MVESKNCSGDRSIAEAIEAYLQAYLETGYFIGSALVSRAGEVLLSKGYGMANLEHSIPNTSQTKFRLASVTKQFTAAAILKLQEQNLLDVNYLIGGYILLLKTSINGSDRSILMQYSINPLEMPCLLPLSKFLQRKTRKYITAMDG